MVPVARLDENLWESVLSFLRHVAVRRQTLVIRLGSTHFSPPNPLLSIVYVSKIHLICKMILLMCVVIGVVSWPAFCPAWFLHG